MGTSEVRFLQSWLLRSNQVFFSQRTVEFPVSILSVHTIFAYFPPFPYNTITENKYPTYSEIPEYEFLFFTSGRKVGTSKIARHRVTEVLHSRGNKFAKYKSQLFLVEKHGIRDIQIPHNKQSRPQELTFNVILIF